MQKYIFKSILLLITLVMIPDISNSKPAKKKPKYQINKLLIIVLHGQVENRRILETELSFDFYDLGVKTITSHKTKLVSMKHVTKQSVVEVCETEGADGVLLVRLVDTEQENQYSYNQRTQYTGGGVYFWGDYNYAYGNYFDAVNSTKVIIETDVYTVPDAQLIFEEERQFSVGEVEEAIGKFAGKVSKRIFKQKFLVSQKLD